MRTQALSIALTLAAVALSGGCGSATSSESATVSDPGPSEIVFTVRKGASTGWNEIWVMDDGGGKRRRLTAPKPSGSDAIGSHSPAWSPQGDRIAFVGSGNATDWDSNLLELYVMDVESGETRQLTENSAPEADPTWSPDGKRIAFVRTDGWATDKVEESLRIIEEDGSGEETLVHEDGRVFLNSPAWSPDGKQIAYSRELTLKVMRSDGSNVKQVADRAAQPAWSPDGKQIAFTSVFGVSEIHVADADGSNARTLIKNMLNAGDPAWAPDGKQIVFTVNLSNSDEGADLYVVPATGGTPKRLTRNKVSDFDPDWR